MSGNESAEPDATPLRRLRVECVAGPWWDGAPCVRWIDVPVTASLYDLHEAIQEAVEFDNEYPFRFFLAESAGAAERETVPAEFGAWPAPEADEEAYERIGAVESVPERGRRILHYAFLSAGGDWIFEIRRASGPPPRPVPGLFYPGTVEDLSEGPAPAQHGYGLDDFAESEEELQPSRFAPGEGGEGEGTEEPYWDDDGEDGAEDR